MRAHAATLHMVAACRRYELLSKAAQGNLTLKEVQPGDASGLPK